jgi:hypothetical protein
LRDLVGATGFEPATMWVRNRADLMPVYAMIFRRLHALGADWVYHFPQLYLVELPTRHDPHRSSGYSVTESAAAALKAQRDRAEVERMRELAEIHALTPFARTGWRMAETRAAGLRSERDRASGRARQATIQALSSSARSGPSRRDGPTLRAVILRERWRASRLPSVPSALRGLDPCHALPDVGIYRSVGGI